MIRAPGNLDPGQLDRRVVLQSPATTRDAAGGAIVSYSTSATVWAAQRPLSGARLFAAQAKRYAAEFSYRIRYRTDVVPGWRLLHGTRTYEITAITELGRAHLLELELRGLDQVQVSGTDFSSADFSSADFQTA